MTRQLSWLDSFDLSFPDTTNALADPNGLLAVGGDLSINRLLSAYQRGIFPWFSEGQPILWWTPDPRMVLAPKDIYINRSLKKLARKQLFTITVDQVFEQVVDGCASPRTIEGQLETGTWITEEIRQSYLNLHSEGFAHSIEAWSNGVLVGGLYGVALGKVFFGESMFSRKSGASKIAFSTLVKQLDQWDFQLIDCQMHSHYLESFGAKEIPRKKFEEILSQHIPDRLAEEKSAQQLTLRDWVKDWTMPDSGFSF